MLVISYWLLVVCCVLAEDGGQNTGEELSSVVATVAGGRRLKWVPHDPMWILGRGRAEVVGPAREASVGWCGWITVGWQASKFRCPMAEKRGRVPEFAGGRRRGTKKIAMAHSLRHREMCNRI